MLDSSRNTSTQDPSSQVGTGRPGTGQEDPLWIDGPWPARLICTSPYHRGSRWLLALEFNQLRRPTSRKGLRSWCKTCQRLSMRKENMTPERFTKQVDYSREYKAQQRREAGVPRRKLREPRFRATRLIAWLEPFIVEVPMNGPGRSTIRFNGKPLSSNNYRFVEALRRGEIEFATLQRVDALCTEHELPLWEVERAAASYKRDKRTGKRKREAKRAS